MAKYSKEQALKIVQKCAVKYQEHLLNKSILFLATNKHKHIIPVEVFFTKRNFQHLTGLKTDRATIPATRFFDLCIDERLSVDDYWIPDDGTTDLKLDILPMLISKNLSANSIGDFNGTGIDLYTEKLAGSIKGCMGFRIDADTGLLMPNTVLNKDIRECTKSPQYRIIATYRKRIKDERYFEIVYAAKGIIWDEIHLSDEYAYLPIPDKK